MRAFIGWRISGSQVLEKRLVGTDEGVAGVATASAPDASVLAVI
jgi:O-acetylhomoserine/O-acetylserine sulfhydrylase-like pyridoxal-dependent enzyme